MSRPSLDIRNVSRRFGRGPAGLADVSLSVPPGVSYALLGANGAGKTTLLNLCLGHLRPEHGTIHVCDIDAVAEPVAAAARLAYVPELARAYERLSGLENLRFFDNLGGEAHDDDTYLALLDRLRFPLAQAEHPFGTYSKGMRQKTIIGIGLLKRADVFLLDEPSSGLDFASCAELARVIRDLVEENKSVLFTSHDLAAVDAAADIVGTMNDGRLVREESIHLFRSRSRFPERIDIAIGS